MIGYVCAVFTGFASGIAISAAVFAFIAIIGVVPRLAQKTKTANLIIIYEEAIIFGGIFGTLTMFFNFSINLGIIPMVIFSSAIGIFYGAMAVSLAEVLNVIPIGSRRLGLKGGLSMIILMLALGKLAGSLAYWFIPGFFKK